MRAPTERDQCQATLDRMVDAFMYDDWTTFREAVAFLRDYVDQRQSAQGKMRRGRKWYMPKQVEAIREHARSISVPRITSEIGR
jgi:predicted deacetylase